MRLRIWHVHIKSSSTDLGQHSEKIFLLKKVGSENFKVSFINTGRSNLINFLPFNNCMHYSLYSCYSLSSILTLIMRSLECSPEYFLTNGIPTLFAAWSFLLSKSQDSVQHLPVFYNKVLTTVCYVILHIHIQIFISTVWNILLCNPQDLVLHLSVFSHK